VTLRVLDSIPSARLSPPLTYVPPPVHSKQQELPFHELSWEMFEALCLRLARADAHVEACIPYGRPGQSQHGIDLFGWRQNDDPVVYQCKKHARSSFRPGLIDKEVKRFIEGRWGSRAKLFVFCCIVPLTTTKRADAVDRARETLTKLNIGFEPWEATHLAVMLKRHPELVDDFFGREWVKVFNGEEAATSLGERLTEQELCDARAILREAARTRTIQGDAFGQLTDAGLPPFIDQRVIVHDLTLTPSADVASDAGITGDEPWTSPVTVSPDRSDRLPTQHVRSEEADAWIARGRLCHLVGEVGQGKSTLLRRIELDLLTGGENFARVASRDARRIPVLVSFPSWVALCREGPIAPADAIERLVSACGAAEALPAVRGALRDRAVHLLVDGLDEATDAKAAKDVLRSIDVWARQDIPIVIAGRSSAQVAMGHGWHQAKLAPLGERQQRGLAEALSGSKSSTRAFLRELAHHVEIARLAGVPMFFRFLYREWLHGRAMPVSRSAVVDGLVRETLVEQPQRRSTVGGQTTAPPFHLDVADIRELLANFALYLQLDCRTSLEQVATTRWWREETDALRQNLELRSSKAAVASWIFEWCHEVAGILRRSETGGVGFRHRAIQERLTAESLAKDEKLLELVRLHGNDPWWSGIWPHVIAAVAQTDLASEVVGCLEVARVATPGAFHLDCSAPRTYSRLNAIRATN